LTVVLLYHLTEPLNCCKDCI